MNTTKGRPVTCTSRLHQHKPTNVFVFLVVISILEHGAARPDVHSSLHGQHRHAVLDYDYDKDLGQRTLVRTEGRNFTPARSISRQD